LGQVSFIAAYVMLMVLARLQSFDPALEEAALDLGASHPQMLRRVLLPHLFPAVLAGAVLAFFQSVENFNTTQFTRGSSTTLTVYVGSKVRSGITPTINALAMIMITLTIVGAIAYEIKRRRDAAKMAALDAE
jgi:spermidine/putrescine transport system permease protein